MLFVIGGGDKGFKGLRRGIVEFRIRFVECWDCIDVLFNGVIISCEEWEFRDLIILGILNKVLHGCALFPLIKFPGSVNSDNSAHIILNLHIIIVNIIIENNTKWMKTTCGSFMRLWIKRDEQDTWRTKPWYLFEKASQRILN